MRRALIAFLLLAHAGPALATNIPSTPAASIGTNQVKIATTGTRVQFPSAAAAKMVTVTANPLNSASVCIGGSSVTNTQDGTGNCDIIAPGNAKVFVITNANLLYLAGTSGDWVSFNAH